jgi:hypothetical protein
MTDVAEVPQFVAENCTAAASAGPVPDARSGLVHGMEEILETAVAVHSSGRTFDRLRPVLRPLAREAQQLLAGPMRAVPEALGQAYATVVERMGMDSERRAATDAEFAVIHAAIAEFPLAKTAPFFEVRSSRRGPRFLVP